jgi:hypothetical protein
MIGSLIAFLVRDTNLTELHEPPFQTTHVTYATRLRASHRPVG